jgi:acetate kinase
MLLLFDPEPPYLRWCVFEQGAARSSRCSFGTEWFRMVKEGAGNLGRVKAVGYLLRHGGDRIKEPVLRVTPQTLDQVEDAIRFLPEFNDITCKVLDRWTKELPAIPHFLFCDTAFFSGLPDVAGTYAVPEELREKGVRRYGSYGLVHQWAWDEARSLFGGNVGRMVSVYLGDHTNVAALRDGKSLDTTIGFTPVEGIPSRTGCGDIDATIVFELHSAGMSFREINELLSRKSGFKALLGHHCSYRDFACEPAGADTTAARDILVYDVVKSIGAFTATLGGLDTLTFATRHPEESISIIREICGRLDFLRVRLHPVGPAAGEDAWKLSDNSSKMNVSLLKSDIWKIMAHLTEPMIEEKRP